MVRSYSFVAKFMHWAFIGVFVFGVINQVDEVEELESFFATFKKRVIQRKIYATREEAKGEIFNFIEMFYNPVKRHSHTGGVSPVRFEEAYFGRLEGV